MQQVGIITGRMEVSNDVDAVTKGKGVLAAIVEVRLEADATVLTPTPPPTNWSASTPPVILSLPAPAVTSPSPQ